MMSSAGQMGERCGERFQIDSEMSLYDWLQVQKHRTEIINTHCIGYIFWIADKYIVSSTFYNKMTEKSI